MKQFLIVAMILVLQAVPVSSGTGPSPDPLDTFTSLVTGDGGLAPEEKEAWITHARRHFADTHFTFNYGSVVYQIFSQARFDEVDMERAAAVAFTASVAIERGGLEREVVDLALLAFSVDLTPDEIGRYAVSIHRCDGAGVPRPVSREIIRNARTEHWSPDTLTAVTAGLVQAAAEGLDTEKVALYMLISVAQQLGTIDVIVRDALADARKRRGTKTPAAPRERRPPEPAVALDYDRFRASIESFLGTPYVWGGNTRRGVDCSGFTRLVMKENGYTIPRVSRDQARVGKPVRRGALQLGDLLFFDTRGLGRVSHVGIYLGGNLLCHASSSKGVTLVLFSNRYFQSRFLSAQRIVRYLAR